MRLTLSCAQGVGCVYIYVCVYCMLDERRGRTDFESYPLREREVIVEDYEAANNAGRTLPCCKLWQSPFVVIGRVT